MSVKMKVEGLKDVQIALRRLPDATAKGIMRRVLREAGKPIAEAARRLAPVADGHLRDSIAVSTKLSQRQRKMHRKGGKDDVEVFVGAGPHPQAHMQEFGTVDHPAQPFMRPAWDQNKRGALEGIKAAMWREILKSVERLRRKAMKKSVGRVRS